MANKHVKAIKGASRRQYADIARKKDVKVCDGCAAVGARRSDAEVTERVLSRGARKWHMFTVGGEPICDVCKRVGHVARCCWQRRTSLSSRRSCCGGDNAGTVLHSVVENRMGDTAVDRHITVSVNGQQVKALLDFNAMENAISYESV